jgi:hypothetical protein
LGDAYAGESLLVKSACVNFDLLRALNMMMTFKEIDKRIAHYQSEVAMCTDDLKMYNNLLSKKISSGKKLKLEQRKMTTEFFSFVTTAYIDLLSSYKNFKRSKSDWEKFFNLKISYLIIYETINTYHQFRRELFLSVNQKKKEEFQNFFRMLNDELAEFKEKYGYDQVMPKIRNKSTAHYDKNFLDYYSSYVFLHSVNGKEVIRDFLYFINPLHYFIYALNEGEVNMVLFVNSWFS